MFRTLLRLLPGEFRGDFGDAMRADALRAGANWWTVEIPGLLAAIVREHADTLRLDLRYTVRLMRRTPGFTAMAIAMLGVGTGVNVAMFSVIDAVMFRSAFPAADRLVIVQTPDAGGTYTSGVPTDRYRALAAAPGPLASIGALDGAAAALTGVAEPRRLNMHCVTPSMFAVLGTPPLMGRPLADDDARAGAAPAVVISFKLWRELGGSPSIVGGALRINDTPARVVGVMPEHYGGAFDSARIDGWAPLDVDSTAATPLGCETSSAVNAFGRLRDGQSIRTAESSLRDVRFLSLVAQSYEEWRTPFLMLGTAVVFVLLIGCGNVSSLQLERTLARRRELAMRTAIGASRARIVRQWLTESLVLAAAGAVAGVAGAAAALKALVALLPATMSHASMIAVNGRALAMAVAAALVSGLISGMLPLVHALRVPPGPDLGDVTRATARNGWARRVLVGAEVALAVTLVIGAGLMMRSFAALAPSHPGFDPANTLTTMVRLPSAMAEAPRPAFDALLQQVRGIPGVRAATASTFVPMSGTVTQAPVSLGQATVTADAAWILPDYFDVLRIALVSGRAFTDRDAAGATPVAIVNAELARRLSPDGDVLGRTISVRRRGRPPVDRVVVGVLSDVRTSGHHTRPSRELYVPFLQEPIAAMNLFVATDGHRDGQIAAAVREAIRAIGPGTLIEPITPLSQTVDLRVADRRLGTWLLGLFAAIAAVLALAGLMTTIGWWVAQRRREIGVRIALGASRGQVRRLILGQGLGLAASGVIAGLAIATAVTRYMASWLYGVTPLDAATFAAAAAAMLAAAIVAVAVPTRRASRVNAVAALRAE